MDLKSMTQTAKALVAPGKGILAADESTPTMKKRLAAVGLESTDDGVRSRPDPMIDYLPRRRARQLDPLISAHAPLPRCGSVMFGRDN
ncbi:MAG TPA: class I fructose-bisphosphate aldolase [Acidimicrobiales bacterium]|nr:class I fructose-bisphosphate aldolase [Acidimicrobiales bacterium]